MKKLSSTDVTAKHRGFSLIELMISITIGLVLMIFVTNLFFSSFFSARLNDDNAWIQEDAHVAMTMMGRSLMQAGYGNMLTAVTTDFTGTGFKACQNGFRIPLTADFQCKKSGSTEFIVSYMVSSEKDERTGRHIWGKSGEDCNAALPSNGALAGPASTAVVNRYFTQNSDGANALFCEGNGKPEGGQKAAQAMLNNVDKMSLVYGVDTNGKYAPSAFFNNANDVDALPLSPLKKKNWDQVINVRLCLELHSDNQVISAPQLHFDCAGNYRKPSDKKLHPILARTFTLRNHAQPTLADY